MDKIKQELVDLVLSSQGENFLGLDSLVEMLYKEESYTLMLSNYYIGFFIGSHRIDGEKIPKDLATKNTFEKRSVMLEVAKEVGVEDMFVYYEEVLKEMNRNYQSNAVDIVEATLRDSEKVIAEALETIGELANRTEKIN